MNLEVDDWAKYKVDKTFWTSFNGQISGIAHFTTSLGWLTTIIIF
ncbi:hypothetical protein [uncultured Eudoraea sp.]|nr:hypothetical protein [uncultured Eudoraea sp.]